MARGVRRGRPFFVRAEGIRASSPAETSPTLLLDGQDEDADAQREILAALRAEGEGEGLAHAAAAQRIAERVAAERPRRSARLAGVPEEQA